MSDISCPGSIQIHFKIFRSEFCKQILLKFFLKKFFKKCSHSRVRLKFILNLTISLNSAEGNFKKMVLFKFLSYHAQKRLRTILNFFPAFSCLKIFRQFLKFFRSEYIIKIHDIISIIIQEITFIFEQIFFRSSICNLKTEILRQTLLLDH